MKKLKLPMILMLCIAMMIGMTACEEEFTPAQLQVLTAQNKVLQRQVDEMQMVASEIAEEMATAEIVDADAVAKLARINEKTDKVQAQIAIIAQALEGVPLTGDNAQDFIAQLQAANAASSGVNPYAVTVGSGLSILSILLAWVAKRKAAEAAAAQLKYQAHKQGVDRTMKEVSASTDPKVKAVEAQLYNNIGEARADLG